MNNPLSKTLPSFIWHFLKPYKFIVLFYIIIAMVAGCWGPFNNMLIKYIINLLPQINDNNSYLLVWPIILIILNFIIFDNMVWRSVDYLNYQFQAMIKNQIISETVEYTLRHSSQFFQDNLSGRITNHIIILASNIELILHRISLDFIRGLSLLVIAFITEYYVNPMFFYILFFWFLAFSSFSIFMSRKLVNLADNYANSESIVSGQLVDCITNHNDIRIFSRRNYEISRMNHFFSATKKAFQEKEWCIIVVRIVQGLMIATMIGFTAYFLIYLYCKHLVSIGDFALILGLSIELGHMMWYTMSGIADFNQAFGKCKQTLSSLMIMSEIQDKPDAKEIVIQKGQIIFNNIKFHYKEAECIFRNKSIIIEAGEKIGLVGYSGAGKSTLANLIPRLHDISEGAILIDNQDIRTITQDSLRRNIAIIPQDPSLFHRTIMDNIRYGKIDATDKEVISAAKKAHAHEFILQLPQGYESLAGERGIKLSGGQRQRIAIARAILKNAPILILDEATSQLDTMTEMLIQDSLLKLMKEKTTIVIAHRLSTLLSMDRILVLDKGRIVEEGNHEDLLMFNGLYKALWDKQMGGFLPSNKNKNEYS